MSKIPRKSLILCVNKKYGKDIISWLKDQNIINPEFKINTSKSILYIPIKNFPLNYEEKQISFDFKIYPIDSAEIQGNVKRR